jgi:hypothetical protein
MKAQLVTSHLDLDEISMVGPLKRGPEGNWVFGVMWKRTGSVGNVDATPEIDQDKRFSLDMVDESKPIAEKNYTEFLEKWYGRKFEGGTLSPVAVHRDLSADAPIHD